MKLGGGWWKLGGGQRKADEKLEANGVRRMVAAYGARWLVGVGWWNLVGGR